jgi:hypothetical protein
MNADKPLVTANLKVGTLPEAYPKAEQVLVDLAPPFRKLRNPVLRRTVARVTSLAQAARVANIPLSDLIQALRRAVGQADEPAEQAPATSPAASGEPAPPDAVRVLIDGLTALGAERAWFESHARRLDLDLAAPRHRVCSRYADFLVATAYSQPFAVSAAMLFGVEAACLAAWSRLDATGPYAEFVQRWSDPRFAAYVGDLQALAEGCDHPDQQYVFNEVLRHERDFWQMTWEN